MAASVISIAVFTAGVTSHLTTKQLEGDVHGAADLQSVPPSGRRRVLDVTFHTQDYAIALPDNSPLRIPINRAILAISDSQEWRDLIRQYLGTETTVPSRKH